MGRQHHGAGGDHDVEVVVAVALPRQIEIAIAEGNRRAGRARVTQNQLLLTVMGLLQFFPASCRTLYPQRSLPLTCTEERQADLIHAPGPAGWLRMSLALASHPG